ncbi:MAG: AraC family transcriptional regulator [Bifidobacterium psychraerophilum]|uniref:AraC family transcriptional regulator n=1 Tax=Bifidobacterium psychraerophilum TaxID=218140 RepID=UPI0039ED09E6
MSEASTRFSISLKRVSSSTIFRSCGIARSISAHTHDPLSSEAHVNTIRMMLNGEDELFTSGMQFTLRRGDGFLSRPGADTVQQSFSPKPCLFIWLSLSEKLSEHFLRSIGLTEGHDVFFVRYPTLFLRLVVSCLSRNSGSVTDELELNSISYHFLHLLSREMTLESGTRTVTQSSAIIRQVKNYVLNHYKERITVLDIAQALNINRSYLSREFHETAGMTLKNYLDHIRITKATDLLLLTDMSLDEVARQSGYQSTEVFTNNFKRVHSVSPGRYRQLHVEQGQDSHFDFDIDMLRLLLGDDQSD